MRLSHFGSATMLILSCAGVSVADTIAISQAQVVGHQEGGPYGLGRYFEVGAAGVRITNLGAFDSGQDGIASPVTVSIYSTADHATPVITGVLKTENSTLAAGNGFRFLNALPASVDLAQGEYIVVASPYGAGSSVETNTNTNEHLIAGDSTSGFDPAPSYDGGSGLITFPSASTENGFQSAFATVPGAYPTSADNGLYAAGSFTFTSVPEPTAAGILAGAVVSLLVKRRRRAERSQF